MAQYIRWQSIIGVTIPVKVLEFVDSMVQDATEAIMAMAKASKTMLAMDVQSLMAVSELLTLIEEKCVDVQDRVNWYAETCGANHVDDERSTLSGRLDAQHHAPHGTKEVPHV